MEKVTVGVFGAYRGYTMINQLMGSSDAVLVAVCDKYEPLLEKVKARADELGLEVALYVDFEEFIKHDMDAVVLANYANEHATYAIRCLDAGKHVMSEVLPAETPAQAVALIEAVERTGSVYAYAENYCYMKAPFEMWRRYKKGDIGEAVYCEGEYIHDCTSIWPSITYGDPAHWRNRMYATFYCTHSVGPLLTITGLRPVSVVGFETNLNDTEKQIKMGCCRTAGIEMVTLENGAVCKSIHGDIKREPGSHNYQVYGKTGMMESARYNDGEFNIYKESPEPDVYCQGEWEKYDPEIDIQREAAANVTGHGGSDFYTTYFFIQKILGRPDGDWSIDVYTAVDMGLCGILAYRSILAGNQPVKIPNFRNKEEREAYRYDNACTNPDIAGDRLLPHSSHDEPQYGPEVYAHVAELWRKETEAKAKEGLPQLYMRKAELGDLDSLREKLGPLPEGITLRTHVEGRDGDWEDIIERSFGARFDFKQNVGSNPAYLPERVLYLTKDGRDIAVSAAVQMPQFPCDGWLHFVGVDPEARGMGLSTRIVLETLYAFKAGGFDSVVLSTDDHRLPAIKSYLKLGFLPMMTHESHEARWKKVMEEIESRRK